MSRFLFLPTLELCLIKPLQYEYGVDGSAIDGGQDSLGQSHSVTIHGGGRVSASFHQCTIRYPEQNQYINALAARLGASVRYINVPIITDGAGPFPRINGKISPFVRVPFSDGAGFSDKSTFSQATVWGELMDDAPLNAGIIKMRIYGAPRSINWSDWFSIFHDEGERPKGHRAYRTWETLESAESTITVEGELMTVFDLTVAITPTLRQAVTAGKRLEFSRPLFVGKFPPDFSLRWTPNHRLLTHITDIPFVEAF